VGKEHQADAIGGDELQHLKRVSRIKHVILEKYFPSWAMILGSRNCELAYVDCFAGPGQYEMAGKAVEGSPVIAVGVLISEAPTEQELRHILLRQFKGKVISFEELCERTWNLPFIPRHYRAVLRSMEGKEITISRVTSKKTGIGGADQIRFK